MKTVERALQQVEGLVQSLTGAGEGVNDQSRSSSRMDLVFTSGLTPSWEVEADLVKLYLSLGLTKAALDTALKLEMWSTLNHFIYRKCGIQTNACKHIQIEHRHTYLRVFQTAYIS